MNLTVRIRFRWGGYTGRGKTGKVAGEKFEYIQRSTPIQSSRSGGWNRATCASCSLHHRQTSRSWSADEDRRRRLLSWRPAIKCYEWWVSLEKCKSPSTHVWVLLLHELQEAGHIWATKVIHRLETREYRGLRQSLEVVLTDVLKARIIL